MRKESKTKAVSLQTLEGQPMAATAIPIFFREVLKYWHGTVKNEDGEALVFDPDHPMGPDFLKPSPDSPICKKCGLFTKECRTPFFDYTGPEKPLVTIVYEGVSRSEDDAGELLVGGPARRILSVIEELESVTGVSPSQIRWIPIVRCADRVGAVNVRVKGNWCRLHAVEDLLFHPPKLIIAVGTGALGLLCHKSNAGDWQGKVLTYRGWPDDWLSKEEFMLPRPDPRDKEKTVVGHPVFGPAPKDYRIPLVPIQSVKLVLWKQNAKVTARWRKAIGRALVMAKNGIEANTYTRPWYRYTNDPRRVELGLREMLAHPGLRVCYDTETTGLKPLAETAAIVSMMFRWVDPETKQPRSLGFPWNFQSKHYDNRVYPSMAQLEPLIIEVLTRCEIVAHNATFDFLYSFFNLRNPNLAQFDQSDLKRLREESSEFNRTLDANLCAMADAFVWDTWHMAYTFKQERGTLGLEMLAYLYVPDMAGYEEDMTLLINMRQWQLFPGAKRAKAADELEIEAKLLPAPAPEGDAPVDENTTSEEDEAKPKKKRLTKKELRSQEEPNPHYLNIGEEYYPTHVIPYIMGDVETCYNARDVLEQKLSESPRYKFPLARPSGAGFRWFQAPSREWVYNKVMSPAARTLMKVMGRGMYVDRAVLEEMEVKLPKQVVEARSKLSKIDPFVENWCAEELAKDPTWELDLESKAHLKYILFDLLQLPVQRLTKTGRNMFGESEADWQAKMEAGEMTERDMYTYAALDKFTLNKLAVSHEQVRPLQEYRRIFKLYSTYVRPLRNIFTAGIDKKARTADAHLCADGCIHASFMLTGTRGGRLSCRDPNLQQLPNKGEVKQMFTSRFGRRGCMYQADLSQIELRLMAAACGDPTMVKAYYDKTDLHTLTTSRIYKLPYEHFSKEHFAWLQNNGREKEAKDLELKRRIGKTVNFLTGYGGGAMGLQTVLANNQVYLELEECESIIDAFFDSYPALLDFLSYYKRFIEDKGVAVSIFGRVRILEEVHGDDREAAAKALRAGCNHIIQSTASDMMLIALIVIEMLMRDAGLESILVSTVHDSLLIDAIRDELPVVHDIVNSVLNNYHDVMMGYFGPDYDISWLTVPIVGDCEVGPSYYDTRKIPERDIDWDKLLR